MRSTIGIVAGAVALAVAGCGGGGEATGGGAAAIADVERDAKFWRQLTGLLEPVEAQSMSDHRAYMLPSGVLVALHFDDLDLDRAQNLNWVALGFPGRYCKEDQERVEAEYGSGFTHFHDLENDVHGGEPGAEGVWFVHVAVRDLEAPWGDVQQGIDGEFMPTPAPDCA
ncbi:MAG TPA: hypothetical protein VM184_06655 [Gaiellaceae bacterium]|nr:hypothetical protein [Gaiellaceae bacterium]